VKKAPIRVGIRSVPAVLTLLAALRLLAVPEAAKESAAKPLEVTYYFLPG